MPDPTVVLVHGAWHGAWVWDEVTRRLAAAGRRSLAPDLPSAGVDPATRGDLAADVRVVRDALDTNEGPFVLVGHSYGGQVISEASAGRDDVVHLVYLCAFLLDVGTSMFDVIGRDPLPWSRFVEDGAAMVVDDVADVLYGDLDAQEAARLEARVVPQSTASFGQPLSAAGWLDIPTTYVFTEQDRAIPSWMQQPMADRADEVVRLDTSHSPFFSAPGTLTDLLVAVA